jgi:hypothetical protein
MKELAVKIGVRNRDDCNGLCDLCRHDESIPGQKLCPMCLQAIARLAFASGVRASPILTGSGEGSGGQPERSEDNVKSYIGDYAYEVRKEPCLDGKDFARWAFMVYKAAPTVELLAHGEDSLSLDHAERNARQLIALYAELDRTKSNKQSGSNNARM